MSIARGVTPTFVLTFEDVDLTEADSVYVTFSFNGKTLTKTGEALVVEAQQISVFLTQKETLRFPVGIIEIQTNWMIDGKRYVSDIAPYQITRQLLDEVLT